MVKELEKARTNLEQQIKDRTKELEKSYEEIRKNAEELRDLIDIAAHELRHPATVFRGYANILLEHWDSLEEETIKDALLKIDSATDRLTRIVVQFSDTSRIERGKMDLSYSETSPMALINNVFAEAQGKGYENELNIKPPEEHGGIEVDADKLKSVLGILLDNAVTYSPQGSAIDVWFEQDDRETVYYVADRGPGIPEADRERVFERFYQVEDAEHHSIPGIGLGLYIARSIVEAHGGWIKVEPRDGSGSVFSFGVSNSRRGDSGRG
ncbi:MAG: HAMP domain-containing histidine kinase [Actinobacteria bacterium]|nr:HAMP domain-containing histidine kinase [Actinomycetota bacterium]